MTLIVAASVAGIILAFLLLRLGLRRLRMRLPNGFRGPWWVLRRFVVVIVALFCFGALVGIAGPIGFALWISSIVIAIMMLYQHRTTQRRALLALLALAAEKNIPLVACVDAFAREQGGKFGANTSKFAGRLFSGMPLPEAVAKSRSVLPRLTEVIVRAGTDCNQLGPALRDEINKYSNYEPIRNATSSRLLYLYILLAVAPSVLIFMAVKIAPAYIKIFDDFEIELPWLTVWALSFGRHFTMVLFELVKFLAVVAIVCGALWYMGWNPWVLPGLRRTLVRFNRSAILRALAFPAELQRPLQATMGDLSNHYPNRVIRSKLQHVSADIGSGHDWIASMQSQDLLEPVDAGVLRAAQQVGNLSWALREMAESNERRLIYRMEILIQIASAVVIVLLGNAVAFFCVACFLPLVKLIWSLTL